MRSLRTTALLAAVSAAALVVGAGEAAAAKTFVFCSEGSPEGFNPQFYTSGTSFDVSAETIYGRLIEFEYGSTKTQPGLAESYQVSDDGLVYMHELYRIGTPDRSIEDLVAEAEKASKR